MKKLILFALVAITLASCSTPKTMGEQYAAMYDENTMTLYVTGGGGCLIKNFSKVNADRVKFIEDICAAAKGYEYMAEAQMKAEAKK